MINNNHIKKQLISDIEKYHKGLLSPGDRHNLEKAALDDPFLSDALEGYAFAKTDAEADLEELKKKIAQKTGNPKVFSFITNRRLLMTALKAAAVLVLIAGAGLLIYQFGFNNKADNIAMAPSGQKQETSGADTIKSSMNETAFSNITVKDTEQKKKLTDKSSADALTIITDTVASGNKMENNFIATGKQEENSYAAGPFKSQANEANNNGIAANSRIQKQKLSNRNRVDDLTKGMDTKDQSGYSSSPQPGAGEKMISISDSNQKQEIDKNSINSVLAEKSIGAVSPKMKVPPPETAEPADGWDSYNRYLLDNLDIPEEIKDKQIKNGAVALSFTVNKKGDPVDIKVEKSLCTPCDDEAIRLIKEGPKWKTTKRQKRVLTTINF